MNIKIYSNLLNDIKARIRQAQIKATLSANSEMLYLYWDIGQMIHNKQQFEGWGTKVISRLSNDLLNDLPEEKGLIHVECKNKGCQSHCVHPNSVHHGKVLNNWVVLIGSMPNTPGGLPKVSN